MGWGFLKKIGHVVKSGWKSAEKATKSVYHTAKGVVNSVHKDARDLVKGAGNLYKHTIDKEAGTIQALGGDATTAVTGVAGSLSMPLMLAGGAALLFILGRQ